MSDWWGITVESHGDVSPEFSEEYTALFNGVAVDGKVNAEAWHSLMNHMNASRVKLNHDQHDLSLEQVTGFWTREGLDVNGVDVLTAVRFSWLLCNDG